MGGTWTKAQISMIQRRSGERRRVAGESADAMKYGIKTYVDEMDDPVMSAYVAWPERLYLVDIDGRIAFAADRGPWGFKPEELMRAIDKMIL